MKIRLSVLLIVLIASAALVWGAQTGLWHMAWALLPPFFGLAFLTWGVVNINSQLFVKTECDFLPEGKEVMLTFDDGPQPEKTPQILGLLEKYKAHGVFFCIGKHVDAHPQLARRITDEGHAIGSHSYYHGNGFDLLSAEKVTEELRRTETAIRKATGTECTLFRPPYGITNPNIAKALKRFDYRVIGWNLRSLDTMIRQPEKLEKRVLKRIRPGSIILLHDTAPAVLPVLESILLFLEKEGYRTRLP